VAMFVGSNSRNAPSRRKRLAHDEVEQPLFVIVVLSNFFHWLTNNGPK
jgi:hypothetical protein